MTQYKQVAFIVLNIIQFECILPIIRELKKNKISYDIIIPDYKTSKNPNPDITKLFNDTYKALLKKYHPIRTTNENKNYKILLSPYPTEWAIKVNSEYKVRYQYGFVSNPDVAFAINTNLYYDVILATNKYDQSNLSAFSQSYIVGPLKYTDYIKKTKKTNKKKTILYLPTHGEDSSISLIYKKLIKLKPKYNIICKAHHLTSFLKEEKKNYLKLKKIGVTFDHKESIIKLFKKSDLVISDNSGAIWDAIIADIPTVVINTHKNDKSGVKPPHQILLEKKKILGVNNPKYLEETIITALKPEYIKYQIELKKKLFPITGKNTIIATMNIINKILSNKINKNYKLNHDKIYNSYKELTEKLNTIDKEMNKIKIENENLKIKEKYLIKIITNPFIKIQFKIFKTIKKILTPNT